MGPEKNRLDGFWDIVLVGDGEDEGPESEGSMWKKYHEREVPVSLVL